MSSYASNEVGINAPLALRRAAVAAYRKKVARTHLGVRRTSTGRVVAVLVVTLPDGHRFRFTGEADPDIVMALALRAWRRMRPPEVAGDWKGMLRFVKELKAHKDDRAWVTAQMRDDGFDAAKGAPEIKAWFAHRSSKYGFHRSKGFLSELGKVAKIVGPIVAVAATVATAGALLPLAAGAVVAASGAMKKAGKTLKAVRALNAAQVHLDNGNTDAARKLVRHVVQTVPRPLQAVAREQATAIHARTSSLGGARLRRGASRPAAATPDNRVYALILRPT